MTVRYRYRAATLEGRPVEGILDAPSRQIVIEQLHRQQLYPVAVEELDTRPDARPRGRLGRGAAVALWTRVAATLLHAGMPLDRVLGFTAQQESHERLASALREVRGAVQQGSPLADALSRHPRFFGPMFVAMVAAGEASGALDSVFERLAEHLEEAGDLRAQVQAALLYPAVMTVVAGAGVSVLLLFVVPRFSAILEDVGGTLPATTRVLMALSAITTHWWWLWLAVVAGCGYGAYAALRRPDLRRKWHAARLGWPLVGDLELKYTTARFARTLGLLLHSGVSLLVALRIARAGVSNLKVSEGVGRATAGVTEGAPLASALAGTLPPLALQMIAVGEESGKLEDLCLKVADTYDREVRRAVRTGVALIEPAMILLFGAIVGFVALAMLQAIYSINATGF